MDQGLKGFDNPLYDIDSKSQNVCIEESLLNNDNLLKIHRPKRSQWFKKFAYLLGFVLLVTSISFVISHILNRYFNQIRTKNVLYNDVTSIRLIYQKFEIFKKEYNKIYNGAEEDAIRFDSFQRNYHVIERLNFMSKSSNVTFAVNEFTDWSEEEFKKMLLPVDFYKKLRKNEYIRPMNPIFNDAITDEYPEHFDWRDHGVVTPVKNQGKCGSCWAFATVATVESAYAIAHKELRFLSEQELLDCNLENNACNGGDVDKAFRFVHTNGLMLETEYPYLAQRQNSCRLAGDVTKIDVAYFINPDEKSIIDWLVNFGPVNIGIAVPPDMKPYKSGVYRPSDYDCKFRVLGLHALLIVGYGTTEDGEKYWIVKNSWGNKWGIENGYVYFARGVNACGIEDEPVGILA